MNDAIVNFSLAHLFSNIDKETQQKIHIFDTHFYDRLLSKENICLESDERHKNVARWTKNTDLFKKEMIIFPICRQKHWFTILVLNPGVITVKFCGESVIYFHFCYLLQLEDDCEERQEKEPLVIVLDSMGGKQDQAVQDVLDYLGDEWSNSSIIDRSTASFPFDKKEMTALTPKCPKQPDCTSCGLYLIEFISQIFKDIGKYCTSLGYRNVQDWTNEEKMKTKRSEIATLIQNVSKEQGRYNPLTFPDVQFFPHDTTGSEDLAYFHAYAKLQADKQKDLSLCRQYNWQLSLSMNRYKQLVTLFKEFENKKATACFEIALFKHYLEDKIDEYPYTEKEIMFCLKQMEEDGNIMIDRNQIYCL